MYRTRVAFGAWAGKLAVFVGEGWGGGRMATVLLEMPVIEAHIFFFVKNAPRFWRCTRGLCG